MVTVAITEWNGVVSPLHDAACRLWVVKPDGERVAHDVKSLALMEKADFCKNLGVDVLLFGAISTQACAFLQDRDFDIVSWICGPVDAVLGIIDSIDSVESGMLR